MPEVTIHRIKMRFVGGPRDGVTEDAEVQGQIPPTLNVRVTDGPQTHVYVYLLTGWTEYLHQPGVELPEDARPVATYVWHGDGGRG